jgi:hypothetical protein
VDNEKLALIVGGLILTNFSALVGVLVWGFKHALKYVLLQRDVKSLQDQLNKAQKDLNSAHSKIREMEK